jgi:hypothetical protein
MSFSPHMRIYILHFFHRVLKDYTQWQNDNRPGSVKNQNVSCCQQFTSHQAPPRWCAPRNRRCYFLVKDWQCYFLESHLGPHKIVTTNSWSSPQMLQISSGKTVANCTFQKIGAGHLHQYDDFLVSCHKCHETWAWDKQNTNIFPFWWMSANPNNLFQG